ncbi:anaphase-promoting complex subunit 4 [Euwallacea similis]|uniref:anaphase-promoting complex subunit 4 n=1 Tax=Euwallacea similis TaxID=1736056 RepID=UPI00344FB01B
MFQGIKQLEEKNVANEITYMVWSSRMDLVAFSNTKGEVALHRLSWTRAWVLAPPKEGIIVNGIVWRPDGKVLAIAYSDGNVCLINVETKSTLTKFEVSGEVSFISWIQEKPEIRPKNIYKIKDEDKEVVTFVDLSKPYIRDPPPVSHLEGSINFEDIKGLSSFLQEQSDFNLLVVGTKTGWISIRIFGCWNCLELNINDKLGFQCQIQNVHFTENLSKLFVTVADIESNIKIYVFDTNIFKAHSAEFYHVTMKYIKLYELILYLEKILANITETWESILLEVDKKLAKYASQVPEGGVTADFLDLLMFGVCSDRMQEFLICDLTKKGLEKFGQTMEVSYSNMQSHLFRHIIKFSQNGTFHLAELKGMAAFEERFGIIGLNEVQIQKAIQSNGAFVIKASEMQQIINHSVITYKAFFRWLYSAIMHLMDEPIPADLQKMTQQDLVCITEFLENFDNYGQSEKSSGGGGKFVMERLGQYLMDENLTIKPDMTGNDWTQFIEENECLKNCPQLLTHYTEKSLIQVFKELKRDIEKVFDAPSREIEKVVLPVASLDCPTMGSPRVILSSVNVSNGSPLLAVLQPPKSINIFQILLNNKGDYHATGANFFFSPESAPDSNQRELQPEPFDVIDIQFYSSNSLSVLLQESFNSRRGGIFQLSAQAAIEQLQEIDFSNRSEALRSVNAWNLGPTHFKNVNMPVSKFSVSGTRRVSIVLAENRRKVKLFEMECDEEEDEEVDMSASSVRDDSFAM